MAKIQDVDIPHLEFAEAAAPGTPAAGIVRLYAKTDGLLYSKDDAGAETGVTGTPDHNHTAAAGDGGDLDAPVIDGYAIFNEESAPSTPASGTVALYAKSDGLLYSKDDAGAETPVSGGGGSLTSTSNAMSGDVTMTNANQFYDGPSVSLTAGTWLLVGNIHARQQTGAGNFTAKLWNGTTVIAAAQTTPAGANYLAELPVCGIAIAAGAETWKISLANDVAGCTIKAAPSHNSPGNYASHLAAIKIA